MSENMHQPARYSEVFLTSGKQYDLSKIRFVRWSSNDPAETAGYSVADYFHADGLYLGPDVYGVEPVFEPTEDA